MKRNIYILFTIGLFIWILPSHSVNLNTERLSNLKRLIENNIAYDSIAPIDSVIAWGQQLSPILEKENKMELYQAIHHLPEQEREVVLYRISGELSFREIGAIMGKSENWSRTVFFRAKQKIRREISQNE